jgi:coenzyme Q-binding protein COQ10
MPGTRRTVEMDVPRETLFDVIVDYERYPDFLSDIHDARIVRRTDDGAVVEYGLSIMGKRIAYTLQMVEERPTRVTWSLVESAVMKVSDGSWDLEALGEGRTRATYAVEVKPKLLVPGPVVKALTGRTLPATLGAFEAEARRRAG